MPCAVRAIVSRRQRGVSSLKAPVRAYLSMPSGRAPLIAPGQANKAIVILLLCRPGAISGSHHTKLSAPPTAHRTGERWTLVKGIRAGFSFLLNREWLCIRNSAPLFSITALAPTAAREIVLHSRCGVWERPQRRSVGRSRPRLAWRGHQQRYARRCERKGDRVSASHPYIFAVIYDRGSVWPGEPAVRMTAAPAERHRRFARLNVFGPDFLVSNRSLEGGDVGRLVCAKSLVLCALSSPRFAEMWVTDA